MRRTRSARNKLEENKELGESEPTTCVWQWEVGDGEWQAFPPAECSQLDAAFQAGRASVSLTLSNGSRYKVDLKKMIQTNTATKFQRRIRSHALKQESAGEAGGLANQNAGPAPIKEEEEPEEEPVAKKSRTTDITTEDSDSKEVVKTMVMKGKAPVDSECTAKLGKPPALGAWRTANVTAAHLPGRKERFSGEETDLLAREVRSREPLIYGGGGFPPRQPEVRRAWEEIAASVSSFSGVWRTAAACRKRYNDVRRRGKQKLAAHRRQLAAGAPSTTGSDEDVAVSALSPDGVQGFGGIEVGLPAPLGQDAEPGPSWQEPLVNAEDEETDLRPQTERPEIEVRTQEEQQQQPPPPRWRRQRSRPRMHRGSEGGVRQAGLDVLERELGGVRRRVCRVNARLGRLETLLRPLARLADNLGRLADAVERLVPAVHSGTAPPPPPPPPPTRPSPPPSPAHSHLLLLHRPLAGPGLLPPAWEPPEDDDQITEVHL